MGRESEKLREAMRQWTTGVCVVCSRNNDRVHGMTVNSFTSVSLDPPIISVTLANNTRTSSIVLDSGVFSISILNSTQRDIAERFSGKINESNGRLSGLETISLPGGQLAIQGSMAVLECQVVDKVQLPHSTLFLAKVDYSNVWGNKKPLVYHNREYGAYEKTNDK